MKESTKTNLKMLAVLALFVLAQTFAYDDEVAQQNVNQHVATYVADNCTTGC